MVGEQGEVLLVHRQAGGGGGGDGGGGHHHAGQQAEHPDPGANSATKQGGRDTIVTFVHCSVVS